MATTEPGRYDLNQHDRQQLSPRKGELSLYGLRQGEGDLPGLGRFSRGKGCIGIKKLGDIDLESLKAAIHAAWSFEADSRHS